MLKDLNVSGMVAPEIGKKLLSFLMKPTDSALGLVETGMELTVAIEMRALWKQVFGLGISVLEMLSMGPREALENRVVAGLVDEHVR